MNNINILIVEDDANIRSYLRNLINSSNSGFAVIAEADNGLAGAQMAKRIMPDIIITDIFMPIMTGFEMLDELADFHFETLILSGYDDFQYLKLALKYGVTDYLLKPINEKDLFDTLGSMREKLAGKRTQLNADTLHFVRSHYIRDLFRGSSRNITPDIFLTLLSNNQNPFYAAVYLVSKDIETENMQSEIQSFFTGCDIIDFSENSLFVIHSSKTAFDVSKLYSDYLSHIQFTQIGISTPTTPNENIITSIFGAYRCVEYRLLFESNRIYTDSQLPKRQVDTSTLYESFNSLYQHIENNDNKECDETLEILFADAFFFDDFANFKILIMKFLFHLENKYNTIFDTVSNSIEISIDKFENLSELKEHVKEIIKTVINEKNTEVQKYHRVVRDAISLIQEYYATITIEQAAEQLFISPSYLMYLFKQDTGETFYNYIIDYRISIACKLLLDGKKIYEVSEMVGYKSVKFFSTIFKKRTGLTPSDYAKQKHK